MSLRVVIVNPFEAMAWEGKRPHRYGGLSSELVRRGHQVTWLSTDFRHRTKQYRESVPPDGSSGVDVRFLHVPAYPKNISLRRLASHRAYARGVAETLKALQREEPIDVVVASLPPINSARRAMEFCTDVGALGIVDALDAWPQVLEVVFPPAVRKQLGAVLLAPLRRDVKIAAALASALVGVSPEYLGYVSGFRESEPAVPQAVFLLGFDIEGVTVPAAKPRKDPSRPLEVVYMGTFGRFYDLETIVRAAQICTDRTIQFTCIGDGPTRQRVTQLAGDLGLTNVAFPGFVPDEAAYAQLLSSDIGLVAYTEDYPPSIPTKPFNYLSLGLAVVSSLEGSFRKIMQREQFGLQYQAGNAESLVHALIHMDKCRDLVHNMGERGMEYAREHLDARVIYGQYADFIEQVATE